MFRNKKYMAWNFHLFSNLVSICCETFRNVSKFGLSHFLGLFQFVSVDLLYNLYVSMFRNKKYMAWNFHLFSNLVSICCETFRNVSNFGHSHFLGLFQFVSVDLLYNLYVSMFRNKKYMAWNFHLFSNLVSICCEMFRNVSKFGLSHFWVCFNLFQLIYYIIYMFQCFATRNIWPGIFTFSLTLFQFVAKRFKFRT